MKQIPFTPEIVLFHHFAQKQANRYGTMKPLRLMLLVCLTALIACGGGSGSQKLSGNWQIELHNPATGALKKESGFILQSGNILAGQFLLTGGTICPGIGSAQGQVSGTNVSIAVSQVGQTITLTGTAAGDGSNMNGNYSILESPCGTTQVGNWMANQVAALTGQLQATFTSSSTAGQVSHFSGSVTQGPNRGESTTTLTGSLSSTDAPCVSSASIAGQISGTAVVLNLLSSEGVALGQFVGTMTTDAATITGTYNVLPQSSNGCADTGNAVVSVQAT